MVDSNSSGSAYLEDNTAVNVNGAPAALVASTVTELAERPSWPLGLPVLPSSSVLEHVLASAGARPKDRDAVDQRIVGIAG